MSYIRWICAMHFAKLSRRGNAFMETVNAFRVHRQQKTAACEAAAQARAEYWSHIAENVRRIRAGQLKYVLNRTLQPRHLDHVNRKNMNFREPDAEGKGVGGSFHTTAHKKVKQITFRGTEGSTITQKITALSTLLRNNIRNKRDAIGVLLRQTKQTITCLPKLLQPQTNLSIENNNSNNVVTATPKSLALCAVSKNGGVRDGVPPGVPQKVTQKTIQKAPATADKPSNEPFSLAHATAPDKPAHKAQLPVPTVQMRISTDGATQTNAQALFLPDKPNILVLSQVNEKSIELNKHATATYEALQETKSNICEQSLKLLTAPANTLKSTSQCQISTEPAHCILLPHCDSPMTLLITNVLDKYKVISLPAGRVIPGQPKRHVQIPTRKRSPVRVCSKPDFIRKKY